jgi:hypothetical protein
MQENSSHLSFETITDLALGAPGETPARAHLEACPQCELALARVASLVGVMRRDATEDAPVYAIASILRAFDERQTKSQPTRKTSVGEKIRAVLRLDSAQLVPNFGFRAAGAVNSRQFIFPVGNGALDLRITPTEENWTVSGQVLGEIFDGKVELHGEEINLATDFDSQSQFTLPPIPGGNYRLRLYSESFEVEVPDLLIG